MCFGLGDGFPVTPTVGVGGIGVRGEGMTRELGGAPVCWLLLEGVVLEEVVVMKRVEVSPHVLVCFHTFTLKRRIPFIFSIPVPCYYFWGELHVQTITEEAGV